MRRILCLVAGAACVALAVVGIEGGTRAARAAEAPGSGFARFSLSATAPGLQILPVSQLGAIPAEGDVGESTAQLQSGPQSYALATIAWPGPLLGNAGTTLQLLAPPGVSVPSQAASAANLPIRAEARTGQQPPSTTSSYGAATLAASALDNEARADAALAGTSGPSGGSSTGSTETTATSTLTGAQSGRAIAVSRVDDISLGGGAVKIKSVVSTANATTTGATSSAAGATVISGLEIGGQPATIDQNGVHAGPAGAPVNAIADQIVNSALAQSGIAITISQPSRRIKGGTATSDAGNVVVTFPGGLIVTVGGASVSVAAIPGTALSLVTPDIGPAPVVSSTPAAEPLATAPTAAGGIPAPTVTPTPVEGRIAGPVLPSRLAAHSLPLPRGISVGWVIIAVLGSALIAAGLWRVPGRTLDQAANACAIGGELGGER